MPGVPTSRRWIRRTLVAGVVAFVPAVLLLCCVGPPSYYSEKYRPAMAEAPRPRAVPGPLLPEEQTEPHTCGVHAMSSVYRAYGLDPEAMRLRFRLGTDKPVSYGAPGTEGTIPPDMVRVLRQDGFEVERVRPGEKGAEVLLRSHLEGGQVAIGLTKLGGTYHWVALSGEGDGVVTVCDSLRDEAYEREIAAYLGADLQGLMLIGPARGR